MSEIKMIKTKTEGRPNFQELHLTVKNKIAHPLETFQLIETFVLGEILNPIYQVAVSGSTKFKDLAVLFSAQVICGHERYM